MTDKDWFQLFDNTKDKFEWFFLEYGFDNHWQNLKEARKCQDIRAMLSFMNDVWFRLPDNKFNILANPPGWNEFLALIEN